MVTGDGGMTDGNVVQTDLGPPPDGSLPRECGDGIVDSGEECDDSGPSASCDADCTLAFCGDHTVNSSAGEQCDDGGTSSGDGCDGECQVEIPASCGDRVINDREECDDGPSGSAYCDSDCTVAFCGDSTTNRAADEQCDSGGTSSFDCNADCTLSTCGDGTINSLTEDCDDNNTSSRDGCSASSCSVETGWTCSGEPSYCTRIGGGTLDRNSTTVLSIPDSDTTGVTSTLAVTGGTSASCVISTMTVAINITHTYIGDLTVTLQSPGGTSVILHNRSGSSSDNIVGTYPTTLTPDESLSSFSGIMAGGSWRLQVIDGSGTDVGRLNSWGLHIVCL